MGSHQLGKSGRYQAVSERLVEELWADAVILIVRGGKLGNGLSVSAKPSQIDLHHPRGFAGYLRSLADTIDGGVGPDGVHLTTKED